MHAFCFTWVLFTAFCQHSTESSGLIDAKVDESSNTDVPKLALVSPYTIYRKRMTWSEAQNHCERHEGNLATFPEVEVAKSVVEKVFEISDKVTDDYLHGRSKAEFGLDRRYWIGLTDLVTGEGNWVWIGKGKPLTYLTMWYPGQPDHHDEGGNYIGRPEHCGALWNPVFQKGDRRHTFMDVECIHKYYFICEKDQKKIDIQANWNKQANKNTGTGRGLFVPRERTQLKKASVSKIAHPFNKLGRSALINGWDADDSYARKQFTNKMKTSLGFSELFQDSGSSEMKRKRKVRNIRKH